MAWRLAALLMVAAVMSVASACGGDDSVSLPEPPTEQATVGGDPVDESSPEATGDSSGHSSDGASEDSDGATDNGDGAADDSATDDRAAQPASDDDGGPDLPEPVATPPADPTADEDATADPLDAATAEPPGDATAEPEPEETP